MTNHYIIACSG